MVLAPRICGNHAAPAGPQSSSLIGSETARFLATIFHAQGVNPMELAPKRAGFDADRLNRITDHLSRNYIEPGKIAGCQIAGRAARSRRVFQIARPDGSRAAQADGRRHHFSHLLDDQADHLGGADDALRAGLLPAQRSGLAFLPGMARPQGMGLGRGSGDGDRCRTAAPDERHAVPHRRRSLGSG